ncbi:MAG: GntR family transcriptional regulator [Hyphomicrobiaceae bacterium]|nr:GntR family transcriptional regulator [Hyphomicrobiaceae bacterium]
MARSQAKLIQGGRPTKADTLMQIVRRTLHDEVADQLRALIISGELAPGQKVPEALLSEQFGVSRTPMREALKVLASENFVQLLPNKGAIVTRLTRQEIDELFPIMGALEALAGELACRNLKLKDLAHIKRLHEAMVDCYQRDDWPGYAGHNRAIHEQIFETAGNASLTHLFQQLMMRIRSVRFIAKSSPEGWLAAIRDHEQMILALEARDGAALGSTLRSHLRHKADVVEEALRKMERPAEG